MLMICISTGQNITNLIPAVQYKITSILFLESETAKSKLWSSGIMEVLTKRRVNVNESLYLSTDYNSDIIKIKEIIKSKLPNEPVIFNMGGGQKPHIIAMWELFIERKMDIACYADQDRRGILRTWEYKENRLVPDVKSINVDLTAEEIFTTFGFKVEPGFKAIYGKGINFNNNILDLMYEEEFRELLFNIPSHNENNLNYQFTLSDIKDYINKNKPQLAYQIEQKLIPKFQTNEHMFINFLDDKNFRELAYNTLIKTTLNEFVRSLNEELPKKEVILTNPDLIKLAGTTTVSLSYDTFTKITGYNNRPAFYFEDICAQRMVSMLNDQRHNIIEAFANIKIKKENDVVAEYDILCVTNEGKIVAYDAKTFNFESKDIDARLYNLEKGSGFYRKFNSIIPYSFKDLQNNLVPKVLSKLPFKLRKKNIDFFVIRTTLKTHFILKKKTTK